MIAPALRPLASPDYILSFTNQIQEDNNMDVYTKIAQAIAQRTLRKVYKKVGLYQP